MVVGVDFSPDGKKLITTVYDGNMVVWEANSGQQLEVMKGEHPSSGLGVKPGPDGVQRGFKVLSDIEAGWEIPCAAFSECVSLDGKSWCHALNKEVKVQNYGTDTTRVVLKHSANVKNAVFSPNGRKIVSASDDMTARIWDANSGAELLVLRGHTAGIYNAAFSPDGRRVISASYDNSARVWDAVTGASLAVLRGHTEPVAKACFSPDGQRIATASWDKSAKLWQRRHPDHFWGVAWLPEFWLTAALAVLLLWSLWRDRRAMREF